MSSFLFCYQLFEVKDRVFPAEIRPVTILIDGTVPPQEVEIDGRCVDSKRAVTD